MGQHQIARSGEMELLLSLLSQLDFGHLQPIRGRLDDAEGEADELAERLIAETYNKQQIELGSLMLHADRGSSMKSKLVAQFLADFGSDQNA